MAIKASLIVATESVDHEPDRSMPAAVETMLRFYTMTSEPEIERRVAYHLAWKSDPTVVFDPYLEPWATSEQRSERAEALRVAHGGPSRDDIAQALARATIEREQHERERQQRRAQANGRVRRFKR